MKIHLTSDEINLLIYRYLIENGFVHTAFSFNSEANVPKNPFFTTQMDRVPPNALVGFLQKALLYIYLEYHTSDDTGEEIRCEEPFSIFKRHECWCRPLEQNTTNTDVINNQLDSNSENMFNEKKEEEKIDLNIMDNKTMIEKENIEDIICTQPPIKKIKKGKNSISSSSMLIDKNVNENTLSKKNSSMDLPNMAIINEVESSRDTSEEFQSIKEETNQMEFSEALENEKKIIYNDEVTETNLSNLIHFKLLRKGDYGNGIREVQFSKKPESPNKFVITWEEGCPELWEIDINSSEMNLENSTLLPVFEGGNMVAGTVVSMSIDYIAIGYENGRVTMFSYDGKELISIVNNEEEESPIVSLKLSSSGNHLAIGDAGGCVKILKVIFDQSSCSYSIELINRHSHNSAIFGLCWCSNDSYLLSGCLDKEIIIYDFKNNKQCSFFQEGQILSLKDISSDSSNITCIMDGILSIPILKITREDSNGNLKLDCISRIILSFESKIITREDGKTISSQINSIESHLIDNMLFHIVTTSYNIYLFDESCSLVSFQDSASKSEIAEIVSIFVTKNRLVYVGFNDGSITVLELTSLKVKSRYIESETSAKTISTGIGTISINSTGNLVFIAGSNLPAVYVFND